MTFTAIVFMFASNESCEVVVVGAAAAGFTYAPETNTPIRIPYKEASASVGFSPPKIHGILFDVAI